MSRAQAQQGAVAAIKALRYGGDGYFWLNDMTPRMVAHPMKPELEGKSLAGTTDPTGKRLFVEMANVVKADGQGFVHYMWPRPGVKQPVPKLSYVAGFAPWGWIVATGVYVDDVDAAVRSEKITVAWQMALILLVIGGLALLISRSISRPVARVGDRMRRLAAGEVSDETASSDGLVETREALADLSGYLRESARVAERIADGDLTVEPQPRSERDVLGQALRTMADNLRGLVGSVTDTAGTLRGTSRHVATTSDEAGRAVGEIAVAISEVAQGAERQVRMVESSRAAVHEANRAAAASAETVSRVGRTREAFEVIGAAVAEMTERVAEIAAAVEQIAGEANRAEGDIGEVACVAEQSSASAQQVSASTRQTSASTRKIASSAAALAQTAEQLDGWCAASGSRPEHARRGAPSGAPRHRRCSGRRRSNVYGARRVAHRARLPARSAQPQPIAQCDGGSVMGAEDNVPSAEAALSEAQIAVHWREEEYYPPPESMVAQANANDPAILERFAEEHYPECFVEYAEMLRWDRKWDTILDTSNPPFWKWWVGGRLNVCANCVDRHLASRGNRNALIWVPEPDDAEPHEISYQELHRRVNEFAALLQDFAGVKTGDRVTFHLPMVPELPVSMLACARMGVIHSEVFGGFSGAACGHRIADSQSRMLVTIDSYYRNGELLDHKVKADEAIAAAREEGLEVERVLVWRRIPGEYHSQSEMVEGRDFFIDDLLEGYRDQQVEPVSMPAEAPLFLMYTSGTTGRPKGCQHSTGGYLSYVTGTSKYYQDIHPDDTYWCFADIGWITGHSYIVYGPLSLGTTSVMYEGVPTYPDPGRPWRVAERLGVTIFHTAPTTIRMLRKLGPDEPRKYDYRFKTMTTVGEPIEPDVWRWYHEVVGKREAAITDTWWQTENGGFLGSTLPALQPMKPGSCGPGVLGIYPVIYDENGDEVPKGSGKAGNICIRNPWPGSFQTIWGQPERYIETYYAKYNRDKNSTDWRDWPYFAGDGAVQAADGYFRILGRVDDVINVAGHRLGTKELESAAIMVEEVAEAAAVPVIDEMRGKIVEMYVSLKPGIRPGPEIAQKVSQTIVTEIGSIARPKNVWVVQDMPKTRSGKIMRRVIAAVSNFADVGDVTTLANPEIVEEIRHHVQREKLSRGETPRELTDKERAEIAAYGETE